MNGRKGVFERMKMAIGKPDKIVWMHCASLGEFEQGRPLLEKIKLQFPSRKILLTFFSPSGYEVSKDYKGADFIFYLPMDSRQNAELFYEIVKPELVIFVKYEFWYFYLREAKRRNIPLLLVSAIFRKNQPFFSTYNSFYKEMLHFFTHIFVQNEGSVSLLKTIGLFANVSFSGDTRFDRVIEIAQNFQPIVKIEAFCAGFPVIVAGSTWPEDDKVLAHFVNEQRVVKFIIAPHNVNKGRLKECLALYHHSALFSSLSAMPPNSEIHTIIIDNIGMLSRLYKYATIAYVGGGFGADGIHNVLEAAVYGKPVVFGPVYDRFIEADELIESGGGVSIKDPLQLEAELSKLFANKSEYWKRAKASLEYVNSKSGSTEKIMQFIQENRLFTR